MNKKFLFLFFFFLLYLLKINSIDIGVAQIYYSEKKSDPLLFFKLEEIILSQITEIANSKVSLLNVEKSVLEIKKEILNLKGQEKKDNNIELFEKNFDFSIFFEVLSIESKKERDFYDSKKILFNISMEIKVLILNNKTFSIVDEEHIFVSSTKESLELAKTNFFELFSLKIRSFINRQLVFKEKILAERLNFLFVKINIGKNKKVKAQDVFVSFSNDSNQTEKSVIKIVKPYEEYSLATIIYTNSSFFTDEYFIKKDNINLELQFFGGLSLSDKENRVSTTNDYISFLPSLGIRAAIPVGLTYFRPILQFDVNIIYSDNKVFIPFSFETGCQGEFNIHRFGIDAGFLIGALFAPDKNNNYKTDSFVIRPYLHLSATLTTKIKIFGEVGYRFFVEGAFYKEFQINLSGIYFFFGTAVNL